MRTLTAFARGVVIPIVLACHPHGAAQPSPSAPPVAIASVISSVRHDSIATLVVDSALLVKTTGWQGMEVSALRALLKHHARIGAPAETCARALTGRCVVISVLSYAGTRDSATIRVRWSPFEGCGSQSGTYVVAIAGNRASVPREIAGTAGDCGPRR